MTTPATTQAVNQMLERMWLKRQSQKAGQPLSTLQIPEDSPDQFGTELLEKLPLEFKPILRANRRGFKTRSMFIDLQSREFLMAVYRDPKDAEAPTISLSVDKRGISLNLEKLRFLPYRMLDIMTRKTEGSAYGAFVASARQITKTLDPTLSLRDGKRLGFEIAAHAIMRAMLETLSSPTPEHQRKAKPLSPSLAHKIALINSYAVAVASLLTRGPVNEGSPKAIAESLNIIEITKALGLQAVRMTLDQSDADRPILLARAKAPIHVGRFQNISLSIILESNIFPSPLTEIWKIMPVHVAAQEMLQCEHELLILADVFAPLLKRNARSQAFDKIDNIKIIDRMLASLPTDSTRPKGPRNKRRKASTQ